ncbi:hypothetical protein [Pantoea sp. CTOTU50773]|uniref:hypothetical protein n=1 Tax=Pantoea sp. CTOTU50773 TaxID=2953853 RepID=UPI0028B09753|nr:hypothetical protein [Pantoea sp. CTOTU50773]
MSDKHKALTATQNVNQPHQSALHSSKLKYRKYDESIVKKAKSLLVLGWTPGRVACYLRLDTEFVKRLHSESWNPRSRQITERNAFTSQRLAFQYFQSGADLVAIADVLDLPLFTVIKFLEKAHLPSDEIRKRLPDSSHTMMKEYRKTLAHHASKIKQNEIRTHRTH